MIKMKLIIIFFVIIGCFLINVKAPIPIRNKELYGIKIYDTSISTKIIEIDSIRYIILHEEKIK
jgi:hypothetical protein